MAGRPAIVVRPLVREQTAPPRDLRNRKLIAELLETHGRPSRGPLGTAAAIEGFAEIEAERELFSSGEKFSDKPFEL